MNDRLETFHFKGKDLRVTFVETVDVKDGVSCDVYSFDGDDTKDLAIVTVKAGFKTPLQRILLGDKTLEGFRAGSGTLNVSSLDGTDHNYVFNEGDQGEIEVCKGQIM